MRKCLRADCPVGVVLVVDCCGWARYTLGIATPGKVVLDGIGSRLGMGIGQVSYIPLHVLCLSSCLEFLPVISSTAPRMDLTKVARE